MTEDHLEQLALAWFKEQGCSYAFGPYTETELETAIIDKPKNNNRIFARNYQHYFPSKAQLQRQLQKYISDGAQ